MSFFTALALIEVCSSITDNIFKTHFSNGSRMANGKVQAMQMSITDDDRANTWLTRIFDYEYIIKQRNEPSYRLWFWA